MLAIIIGTLALGAVLAGPVMSIVEHPNYEVTASEQSVEIRRYDPLIIAEVKVDGERQEAIEQGFRLLADYIFGNNLVQQDIAMTAPVQQQANTQIAMTAPVQQQGQGDSWKISFVMPSEYTMKTLPKPNNERVKLIEQPNKTYAAIRFSGTNSTENIAEHEKELMQYLEANKLQTVGLPKYAFYNPPWTLPFLRRNEVMVEIRD